MPVLVSPVEISNPSTLLFATTLVTNIDSACRLSRCPFLVRWLSREASCRVAIITDTMVKFDVNSIVSDPQSRAVSLGVDVVQGRLPPRAMQPPLFQLSQDIHPRTTGARPFRASSSLGLHLLRKTSTT
ncbi:hypothetical protein BKA70DRAFT_1563187 [Coprinopsis sp. MPI-PUGE-AT-0042]|nr:hypothetical protein BKA70DRAFT_1563187 [Coprinopsis sp. MPI-PUGE-AT-0042]